MSASFFVRFFRREITGLSRFNIASRSRCLWYRMTFDEAARLFLEKLRVKGKHYRSVDTRRQLCSQLSSVFENLSDTIQTFERIIERVHSVSREDRDNHRLRHLPDPTWSGRWKPISEKGHDLCKNIVIDYGNEEYTTILQFLWFHSPKCNLAISNLCTEPDSFWPSLHPEDITHFGPHGVIMKGDLIEICLAALRGSANEVFGHEVLETHMKLRSLSFLNLVLFLFLKEIYSKEL